MEKNAIYDHIAEAESRGAEADELRSILGTAASKRGIFEGDTDNGELEIGQVAASVREIKTAKEIVDALVCGYAKARERMAAATF